jgi:hypothetical protein
LSHGYDDGAESGERDLDCNHEEAESSGEVIEIGALDFVPLGASQPENKRVKEPAEDETCGSCGRVALIHGRVPSDAKEVEMLKELLA